MPASYDPSRQNEEKEARWGRPIKDGSYKAKITWIEDPALDRDRNPIDGEVKAVFVIVSTPDKTPEGAVKFDWKMSNDWRFERFAQAFGFPTDEPVADIGAVAKRFKHKFCVAVIVTGDKGYTNLKTLKPLSTFSGDATTAPVAKEPAKQESVADDNPF